MKCEKCNAEIGEGEEREQYGETLCEDCYMDSLSPARTCDPWAVHTAKSLVGQGGEVELNDVQKKILEILKETGGMETGELIRRLDIKPSDFQREIAALRHVEKIRGEKREGKVYIRLW